MPFGVSNSFKRGTIKTYARPNVRWGDDDHIARPRTRQCLPATKEKLDGESVVERWTNSTLESEHTTEQRRGHQSPAQTSSEITSSSPAPATLPLFSSDPVDEDDSELSTPPSSPAEPFSPPTRLPHKPAFSFLKRQQSTQLPSQKLPLSEVNANARNLPASSKAKGAKTQMQIDLGGEVRKTCRSCGMEYMPSLKEDALLHREYCGINAGGIEIGKSFLKDATLKYVQPVTKRKGKAEEVVMVDQKSSSTLKSKVMSILGVVNADLSAADISENSLWHQPSKADLDESRGQKRKHLETPIEPPVERFKALIAIAGEKCVGFCLVEKIKQAFPVIETGCAGDAAGGKAIRRESSSISHSSSAELALLGISRIWVSKAFRGNGIAQDLLDTAQNNFFYGIQIPKTLMAFSQPTESGRRLAVKWFGQQVGWRVYVGQI